MTCAHRSQANDERHARGATEAAGASEPGGRGPAPSPPGEMWAGRRGQPPGGWLIRPGPLRPVSSPLGPCARAPICSLRGGASGGRLGRLAAVPADRNVVFTLRDTRNKWAHNGKFDLDEAYRALDGIEVLLRAIDAAEADAVGESKDELMRLRYASEGKAAAKQEVLIAAPPAGLKPWREVIVPHDDVAAGRFNQAEFAADLPVGCGLCAWSRRAPTARRARPALGLSRPGAHPADDPAISAEHRRRPVPTIERRSRPLPPHLWPASAGGPARDPEAAGRPARPSTG